VSLLRQEGTANTLSSVDLLLSLQVCQPEIWLSVPAQTGRDYNTLPSVDSLSPLQVCQPGIGLRVPTQKGKNQNILFVVYFSCVNQELG
jgi:hypothetical protein